MNYFRYWIRYVRKGDVKGGGVKNGNELASWILLLDNSFRIITISVGESMARWAVSVFKNFLSHH